MSKEYNKSLEQIKKYRIEKINSLKNNDINPYPYEFNKRHNIEFIKNNEEKLKDKSITTAGRVMSIRNMGKSCFLNLQDEIEKIQLYINNKNVKEKTFNDLVLNIDIGDIIGIKGCLFRTKTDELSIRVSYLELLSKNIHPLPNTKEKDGHAFFAFEDKESRYRNRHLDLIINPKNKNVFKLRSEIIFQIRKYLNKKKFMEVETPILQNIYGGASARPFTTYHNSLNQDFYLRIAEELHLKRLIIGGFEKIFEIGKNFRNEGIDRKHNPEFTMLELYQSYVDIHEMLLITEKIFKILVKSTGKKSVEFLGNRIDISKPFCKISMRELLVTELNEDVILYDSNKLYNFCISNRVEVNKKMNYGQLFDKMFSILIEPKLISPIFVLDYPKSISPLAKSNRNNSDLVERFELFIGGIEFANAFSELNDPLEQRTRFEEQLELKKEGDEEAHSMDEEFLSALEVGMPPTGGVGVGIDRLIMLFAEQSSIKDVILFPSLRNK